MSKQIRNIGFIAAGIGLLVAYNYIDDRFFDRRDSPKKEVVQNIGTDPIGLKADQNETPVLSVADPDRSGQGELGSALEAAAKELNRDNPLSSSTEKSEVQGIPPERLRAIVEGIEKQAIESDTSSTSQAQLVRLSIDETRRRSDQLIADTERFKTIALPDSASFERELQRLTDEAGMLKRALNGEAIRSVDYQRLNSAKMEMDALYAAVQSAPVSPVYTAPIQNEPIVKTQPKPVPKADFAAMIGDISFVSDLNVLGAKRSEAFAKMGGIPSTPTPYDNGEIKKLNLTIMSNLRVNELAEQGNIDAMTIMAERHYLGMNDLPKDEFFTDYWRLKLALRGEPHSMSLIGFSFSQGKGVTKDKVKSAYWFEQAAEAGDATSQHFLGKILMSGDAGVTDPLRAIEWWEKAAQQGETQAMMELGDYYLGRGVAPPHYDNALRVFTDLSEDDVQGDYGLYHLGFMAENGLGQPANIDKAISLYKQSAQQGWYEAQYELGMAYLEGRGVEQDRDEAIHWLKEAKTYSYKAANQLEKMGISD